MSHEPRNTHTFPTEFVLQVPAWDSTSLLISWAYRQDRSVLILRERKKTLSCILDLIITDHLPTRDEKQGGGYVTAGLWARTMSYSKEHSWSVAGGIFVFRVRYKTLGEEGREEDDGVTRPYEPIFRDSPITPTLRSRAA